MQLTITIRLGNEAMQTSEDIATALEDAARRVRDMHTDRTWSVRVSDANGNTVGDMTMSEE